MKKMIIALLILCLLGGAVIGYLGNRNVKSGTVAPAEDVSVIEGAAGQSAVAVNEGMDGEGTGLGTGQPEAAGGEAGGAGPARWGRCRAGRQSPGGTPPAERLRGRGASSARRRACRLCRAGPRSPAGPRR